MKAKATLIFILGMLIQGVSFAQPETIHVVGKVIDAQTQEPVEFATVVIGDKNTEKPVTGATTSLDGRFDIPTKLKDFYVEVSFIGYLKTRIDEINIQNGKVNLGEIILKVDAEQLEELVIEGEKSQMEFQLDKRVFNVGKDLSSTGASALEVLNNVPSVNVNIEGDITLRGSSGVQVLINGKPSVIASEQGNALGTITADMIEKVEVITNPSAKYDAEGSSGIINIVIKKEEREGINGSMSINTGTPHNHSFGLSLNKRTEKFNMFTQIGAGYRSLPNDRKNINRDLTDNTAVLTKGREYRNENFYNFILGTDYIIDDYNIITLSGNFAYEIEAQPSSTDFTSLDGDGNMISEWNRTETTEATNPKWQYELQYKRDFKDNEDHTLLFSALGNFFGKDLTSEFQNSTISGTENDGQQQTRTKFQESRYTFKLDYTRPMSESVTIETGAQFVSNDVSNDFAVSDLVDGVWVDDENLTNIFDWKQDVLGIYGTTAYEGEKWGVKFGLRMEHTNLNTLLKTTNEANEQNYTNLFPSIHTSYKITENYSLQAGYSRRIFRPRLWDLNPFFNIRNNFNIRMGNPNLRPTFTDSYEISSIYHIGKASLNASVYYRYTTDVVERVSFLENNVNTTMPINIGTERSTGVEINGKVSPTDWLTINGDFNYSYFSREGRIEELSRNFDFSADQWSTRMNAKFKLPAKIDFELTGRYRSRVQTVQGVNSGVVFADLGLRRKIFKKKGVINFSIRDIFASRIQENEVIQEDFYSYSFRQRGRFITLGFSYGFGKGEAMEYSGRRR